MFFETVARQDAAFAGGSPRAKVAVIGAGPSGLATMIALMRRFHRPFEAWIVGAEDAPAAAFGDGLDGGALTAEPARELSVIPDRPDDFSGWLTENFLSNGVITALRGPQDLHVPRTVFRDYLMARFGEALCFRKDVRIRTMRATVRDVRAERDGVHIGFLDGESAVFDHVFLASGFGHAQPLTLVDPSARALAGLLGYDPATLSVDDCGRLLGNGEPLAGFSIVGTIAARLRPGPFSFAETVRQVYRSVLAAPLHRPARASRS